MLPAIVLVKVEEIVELVLTQKDPSRSSAFSIRQIALGNVKRAPLIIFKLNLDVWIKRKKERSLEINNKIFFDFSSSQFEIISFVHERFTRKDRFARMRGMETLAGKVEPVIPSA